MSKETRATRFKLIIYLHSLYVHVQPYVIEIEFPRPFACPLRPDEKELVSAKFIVCPLGSVYVWLFDSPDAP